MKLVQLPEGDGKISALDIIEEVLCRPFWRENKNNRQLFINISDKLAEVRASQSPMTLLLEDEEREALCEAMRLTGERLHPPTMRFFMRVAVALDNAETPKVKSGKTD